MSTDDTVREAGNHDNGRHKLRWTCLDCGQQWDVNMPGFPGSPISGVHVHYLDGDIGKPCGPLAAVMLGTRS